MDAFEEQKQKKIEPFLEMNKSDKRIPWADRVKVIKDQFPSVDNLKWDVALRNDPDLFGSILRDVLRHEHAESGKDGPKPEVPYREGIKTINKWKGEDYSYLPFTEAFRNLGHKMSITVLARKTSMSRVNVHRLLRGEKEPHVDEMLLIAQAFNKHPSYFAEWRSGYIIAYLAGCINNTPETNLDIYKKLKGKLDG